MRARPVAVALGSLVGARQLVVGGLLVRHVLNVEAGGHEVGDDLLTVRPHWPAVFVDPPAVIVVHLIAVFVTLQLGLASLFVQLGLASLFVYAVRGIERLERLLVPPKRRDDELARSMGVGDALAEEAVMLAEELEVVDQGGLPHTHVLVRCGTACHAVDDEVLPQRARGARQLVRDGPGLADEVDDGATVAELPARR
eukprot:scaffold136038_cov142-Phaeocystis_antarctica.AAC.1